LIQNRRRSDTHLDDLSRLAVLRLPFSLVLAIQADVIFFKLGGADTIVLGLFGGFLSGLASFGVFVFAFEFLR